MYAFSYEGFPEPDGLRGKYYNNPTFKGLPYTFRNDPIIDFKFGPAGPIEGISASEFSVRWDGYVMVPHSGVFRFVIETHGGARLFLNQQAVAAVRMPKGSSVNYTIPGEVALLSNFDQIGLQKRMSPPQKLHRGQKYMLRLEMFYSIHLNYAVEPTTNMKLAWSSDNFEEEIIKKKYLFQSRPAMPLKISGLDPSLFELCILNNGERVFKDDKDHFFGDIPQRYAGRKLIRTLKSPKMSKIDVYVNDAVTLYVAVPASALLPIEPPSEYQQTAHETQDFFSVLEAKDIRAPATKVERWRILYFEVKEAGWISFEVKQRGMPFVMYLEELEPEGVTCSGREQVLSLTGSPVFESCHASSFESEAYGCKAAFSGKNIDQKHGMWRTSGGNGIGHLVSIKFKLPVQVSGFRFKPLDDIVTWPSELLLTFGAPEFEETEKINILHTNNIEHNTFTLKKAHIANQVKIEISSMYTSGHDSGGAFELIGSTCNDSSEGMSTHAIKELKVQVCDATIKGFPEVTALEENMQFLVTCPRNCLISPEGSVYGAEIYAPESTLCTAALHSGVCNNPEEEFCKTLVTIAGPRSFFSDSTNNGINSHTHGPSDISLSIAAAEAYEKLLFPDQIDLTILFGRTHSSSQLHEPLWDHGEIKGYRGGFFYGWLRTAQVETCEPHNKSVTISSGVAFPKGSSSEECRKGADCVANYWSISLPENGKYSVEAQVGSPCTAMTGLNRSFLQVNGEPLIANLAFRKGELYYAAKEIMVKDSQLVVSSICKPTEYSANICDEAITTIFMLKIKKLVGLG